MTRFSPISHGATLHALSTAHFTVTEAVYPPDFCVAPHTHEAPSLTLVLEGGLLETARGRAAQLGARQLIQKPADTEHANRFGGKGARLILVEILPACVGDRPGVLRVLADVRQVHGGSAVAPLLRLPRELRRNDHLSCAAIEGILLHALVELGRLPVIHERGAPPQYLKRVRDQIHEGFRAPLRVADLARDAGVPAPQLARAFRKFHGCGLAEYARGLRLEYAMHALRTTDIPIAVVAARAGFADQSHLTRAMRAAGELAPAAYRASYRSAPNLRTSSGITS